MAKRRGIIEMKTKHWLMIKYIGVSLLLINDLPAMALPSDKQQKLYIVGDSCIYNYQTGASTFEGHVKVDQGTTHIAADRLTTKNNAKHKIEETVAYGINDLAHYWTLPKLGDPEIHARGMIIKFYPIVSNITLERNVTVNQGENSFQGQLIHYNMGDQTITVPAKKNARAVLIYKPDN